MKTSIALLFLIIAAIALSVHYRYGEQPAVQAVAGLPWQIEVMSNGETRVFGLIPSRSTLDEARWKFNRDMEIAVIAAPGEPGTLEAYSSSVTTGVILGKMVLVAEVGKETVGQLRQRAIKSVHMDSSTRKYILHHDDLALAWRSPIASITFIPAANLDEQTVLRRFGAPAERIRINERIEHFLYPDKGLDITLDSQGKEVLQYVATSHFARLREPLIKVTPATTHHP